MRTTDVIGRDAELALTEDFLDALAAGPSGLVIEGEAGAGKTTLWLAAVEEARERGYRVLETRPAEAEAGLPFAGLGDLVEGALDEVLDELPEPQADALRVALLLAPPGRRSPGRARRRGGRARRAPRARAHRPRAGRRRRRPVARSSVGEGRVVRLAAAAGGAGRAPARASPRHRRPGRARRRRALLLARGRTARARRRAQAAALAARTSSCRGPRCAASTR